MYRKSLAVLLVTMLSACNCEVPLEITPIQQTDKKLACKDVILEINEAEHYLQQGQYSKRITPGEILIPSCWISGYMDSAQAVRAANARIDYLGKIYDLLDCDGSAKNRLSQQPIAPPVTTNTAPTTNKPQQALPEKVSNRSYPEQTEPNTNVQRWTHRHVSSGGRIYEHSHPNTGAHSHQYNAESADPTAETQ